MVSCLRDLLGAEIVRSMYTLWLRSYAGLNVYLWRYVQYQFFFINNRSLGFQWICMNFGLQPVMKAIIRKVQLCPHQVLSCPNPRPVFFLKAHWWSTLASGPAPRLGALAGYQRAALATNPANHSDRKKCKPMGGSPFVLGSSSSL